MMFSQFKQLILVLFLIVSSGLLPINTNFANPLSAWESWVLEDHPEYGCPWTPTAREGKACIWPGNLALAI